MKVASKSITRTSVFWDYELCSLLLSRGATCNSNSFKYYIVLLERKDTNIEVLRAACDSRLLIKHNRKIQIKFMGCINRIGETEELTILGKRGRRTER